MKKYIVVVLLFALPLLSQAQENLVGNHSFEDTVACPFSYGQINLSTGWKNFYIAPQYYNACNTGGFSVPGNVRGNQEAADGQAYLSLGMWNSKTWRNIAGRELEAPLKVGACYYGEMKVSLTEAYGVAVNKIGMRMMTTQYSFLDTTGGTNKFGADNFAHIYTEDIIDDQENWVTISGSFVADSAYEYIAIGRFFDSLNTDTHWVGSGANNLGHYYVDEIKLIEHYVDLGEDTALCPGETITINASSIIPGATYEWQDGSTDSVLLVTTPGIYWVDVDWGICAMRDSIEVSFEAVPDLGLAEEGKLCDGDSLTLDLSAIPADLFTWQDGSTGPQYTVTEEGQYSVIAEFGTCIGTDTIDVDFISFPELELGGNQTICEGELVVLDAVSTGENPSYEWQDGSTASTFNVTTSGLYFVTVTHDGLCAETDSITIDVVAFPEVDLGDDRLICDAETLLLESNFPAGTFQWQDGSTENEFVVTTAGTYSLEVTNEGICSAIDSIEVAQSFTPIVDLGEDTIICHDATLLLDAELAGASYLWQDNSTAATFIVEGAGLYSVIVQNECGSASDEVEVAIRDCSVEVPNVFTPNGDGTNDVLLLENVEDEIWNFQVFNRWGKMIHETNRPNSEPWDGTQKNGKEVATGVYFFILTNKETGETRNGSIQVIR